LRVAAYSFESSRARRHHAQRAQRVGGTLTDAGAVGQQPQGYLRPREHRLEIVDEAATTTGSGTRAASTQHSEIIACAHTDDTVDDIRDGGRGTARQRWELAIER